MCYVFVRILWEEGQCGGGERWDDQKYQESCEIKIYDTNHLLRGYGHDYGDCLRTMSTLINMMPAVSSTGRKWSDVIKSALVEIISNQRHMGYTAYLT